MERGAVEQGKATDLLVKFTHLTAFEGKAKFEDGELVFAEYGPVRDAAALDEIAGRWRAIPARSRAAKAGRSSRKRSTSSSRTSSRGYASSASA